MGFAPPTAYWAWVLHLPPPTGHGFCTSHRLLGMGFAPPTAYWAWVLHLPPPTRHGFSAPFDS
ncbi:hypothetical protein B484DRAFT_250487 [Ochromonadaceae sp. CCMP2298]|nr:hypothetical protein B484DRAFT_250487 [Ochromonadaceae sp. CCMP2298]